MPDDPDMIKLHIDLTNDGPFADGSSGAALAGENPWGILITPGLARINNLLFSTAHPGFRDLVKVDGDGEVLAVLHSYACLRGLIVPKATAEGKPQEVVSEKLKQLAKALTKEFPDDVAVSGGFGSLQVQCEPETAVALSDWLNDRDDIEAFELVPSPGLEAAIRAVGGDA